VGTGAVTPVVDRHRGLFDGRWPFSDSTP